MNVLLKLATTGVCLLSGLHGYTQELIPLAVGNTWAYEEVAREGKAEVARKTVTNRVVEMLDFEGESWYLLREFGDEYLIRNTAEGQWEVDTTLRGENGKYVRELVFRKPSSRKTESYRIFDVNQVSVSKKRHKIRAAGKRFRCYRFVIAPEGAEQGEIEFFIHPRIGVIQNRERIGEQELVRTLVDYNIQ